MCSHFSISHCVFYLNLILHYPKKTLLGPLRNHLSHKRRSVEKNPHAHTCSNIHTLIKPRYPAQKHTLLHTHTHKKKKHDTSSHPCGHGRRTWRLNGCDIKTGSPVQIAAVWESHSLCLSRSPHQCWNNDVLTYLSNRCSYFTLAGGKCNMQSFMWCCFQKRYTAAVSQGLTEFQNILPLAGPLNSCHESPLEAITAVIEKIQIRKKNSTAALNHTQGQTVAVCLISDVHKYQVLAANWAA